MSLLVACWVGSVVVALLLPSPVGLLLRRTRGAPTAPKVKTWEADGIPLPQPDDPRWRIEQGRAVFGDDAFVVHAGMSHTVTAFDTARNCDNYATAVWASLKKARAEEDARKALAAITDT